MALQSLRYMAVIFILGGCGSAGGSQANAMDTPLLENTPIKWRCLSLHKAGYPQLRDGPAKLRFERVVQNDQLSSLADSWTLSMVLSDQRVLPLVSRFELKNKQILNIWEVQKGTKVRTWPNIDAPQAVNKQTDKILSLSAGNLVSQFGFPTTEKTESKQYNWIKIDADNEYWSSTSLTKDNHLMRPFLGLVPGCDQDPGYPAKIPASALGLDVASNGENRVVISDEVFFRAETYSLSIEGVPIEKIGDAGLWLQRAIDKSAVSYNQIEEQPVSNAQNVESQGGKAPEKNDPVRDVVKDAAESDDKIDEPIGATAEQTGLYVVQLLKPDDYGDGRKFFIRSEDCNGSEATGSGTNVMGIYTCPLPAPEEGYLFTFEGDLRGSLYFKPESSMANSSGFVDWRVPLGELRRKYGVVGNIGGFFLEDILIEGMVYEGTKLSINAFFTPEEAARARKIHVGNMIECSTVSQPIVDHKAGRLDFGGAQLPCSTVYMERNVFDYGAFVSGNCVMGHKRNNNPDEMICMHTPKLVISWGNAFQNEEVTFDPAQLSTNVRIGKHIYPMNMDITDTKMDLSRDLSASDICQGSNLALRLESIEYCHGDQCRGGGVTVRHEQNDKAIALPSLLEAGWDKEILPDGARGIFTLYKGKGMYDTSGFEEGYRWSLGGQVVEMDFSSLIRPKLLPAKLELKPGLEYAGNKDLLVYPEMKACLGNSAPKEVRNFTRGGVQGLQLNACMAVRVRSGSGPESFCHQATMDVENTSMSLEIAPRKLANTRKLLLIENSNGFEKWQPKLISDILAKSLRSLSEDLYFTQPKPGKSFNLTLLNQAIDLSPLLTSEDLYELPWLDVDGEDSILRRIDLYDYESDRVNPIEALNKVDTAFTGEGITISEVTLIGTRKPADNLGISDRSLPENWRNNGIALRVLAPNEAICAGWEAIKANCEVITQENLEAEMRIMLGAE